MTRSIAALLLVVPSGFDQLLVVSHIERVDAFFGGVKRRSRNLLRTRCTCLCSQLARSIPSSASLAFTTFLFMR